VTNDRCPWCGGQLAHQGPRWARSYECLQCSYQREDTLTDRATDVFQTYGSHITAACIAASIGLVAIQSLFHAASATAVAVAAFFAGRTYELKRDDSTTTNVSSLASTIEDHLGIDEDIRWVYDEGLAEDVYVEGEQFCYQLAFDHVETNHNLRDRPLDFWESSGYRVVRIAPHPEASIRSEKDREQFREYAEVVWNPDSGREDDLSDAVSIELE